MASNESRPLTIVAEISAQTQHLCSILKDRAIICPSDLDATASTKLWSTHDKEVDTARNSIRALTDELNLLLNGPHDFLHEYVSVNWEHGALYALLERGVLEQLPLDGAIVPLEDLAAKAGVVPAKLLRICRLAATVGILHEPSAGNFGHTAISVQLLDEGFRSWVGFQLFETRVASAHLADVLTEGGEFFQGRSAFQHAWNAHMYDWHRDHPEKGSRFAKAMQSVARTLDPGDDMILEFLSNLQEQKQEEKNGLLVIEVAETTGEFSRRAALLLPGLSFEVQDPSIELLRLGRQRTPREIAERICFKQVATDGHESAVECPRSVAFLLRSALWALDDASVVAKIQCFTSIVRQSSHNASLLVCDLVSPEWRRFAPNVERAYRRRDVTLMTMHNAQQRTRLEWEALFLRACADIKGDTFVTQLSRLVACHFVKWWELRETQLNLE